MEGEKERERETERKKREESVNNIQQCRDGGREREREREKSVNNIQSLFLVYMYTVQCICWDIMMKS